MATTTHTPGPWIVLGRDILKHEEQLEGLAAPTIATTLSGDDSHPNARKGIGAAEADRNARLIAAAPDMLSALRGMDEAFMQTKSEPRRRAWRNLRAAIAKAEGN